MKKQNIGSNFDDFLAEEGMLEGTNAVAVKRAIAWQIAGSNNVYADLGYADAAEMQRKSQLAAEITRAIKARRLTQEGAATLLGIDQSKVLRISRGHG